MTSLHSSSWQTLHAALKFEPGPGKHATEEQILLGAAMQARAAGKHRKLVRIARKMARVKSTWDVLTPAIGCRCEWCKLGDLQRAILTVCATKKERADGD